MTVLITRPQPQADELSALLKQAHIDTLVWPVIEFQPTNEPTDINHAVEALKDNDIALFISPRAVEFTWAALSTPLQKKLEEAACIAVGSGTALALKNKGCKQVTCPESNASSESVLVMPFWQNHPAPCPVFIFKGQGGRELLENELDNRGYNVRVVNTYRRVPIVHDIAPLLSAAEKKFDLIISTSCELLEALLAPLNHGQCHLLTQCPVTVMSQRMLDCAKDLGFLTTLPIHTAENQHLARVIQEFVYGRPAKETSIGRD